MWPTSNVSKITAASVCIPPVKPVPNSDDTTYLSWCWGFTCLGWNLGTSNGLRMTIPNISIPRKQNVTEWGSAVLINWMAPAICIGQPNYEYNTITTDGGKYV
jgi:hypothetical protein